MASRFLRWGIRQAARVGIGIDLFFVTREGRATAAQRIAIDPQFVTGFAGPQDIAELVRVEPGTDPSVCEERFRGRRFLCFAIKREGRIVAKMWCDLEECHDPAYYRLLSGREAYLFSAYTDLSERGKDLAPYLRQEFYAALRAQGRDSIFSCTDYFNTAARRFKQKIGAEHEALYMNVTLVKRYSHRFVLKRYQMRDMTGLPALPQTVG